MARSTTKPLAVAAAFVLVALLFLVWAPRALAYSGSIDNVHAVGTQVEATYTTNFDLCTESGYCGWFAHAYQYPASQNCAPEGSHITFVGSLHESSGSETATDSFYPAYSGSIRLCLYALHSGDNYFIAEAVYSPPTDTQPPVKNPPPKTHPHISVSGACHREGSAVRLSGRGFNSGESVRIELNPGPDRFARTNSNGRLARSFPAPSISSLSPEVPKHRTVRVRVKESGLGASSAVGSFLVTTVAVATRPQLPLYGDIPRRVSYRLSGFKAGRPIFAHWRHGHRSAGDQRLGRVHGACGDLRSAKFAFRSKISGSGRWTIQFDQRRSFSPRVQPQARLSFSIVETFLRGQAG